MGIMKILGTTYRRIGALAFAACTLMAQPGPGPGRGGRMGFGLGEELSLTEQTITGKPFSAQETTQFQQILQNGNQIQRQQKANVYRDSQGRVRIESTITPPAGSTAQARTEITIYDPVGGHVYRLDPQAMTYTEFPIRQKTSQSTGNRPAPPSNSQIITTTQNLGTQTINGVTATGTQVTRTIPAGTIGNTQPIQIVRVTWTSTALEIPVQITLSDPRSGTTAVNLTNIVMTEPNASLFAVPSGYTQKTGPGPRGRFGAAR